jgi:hypothetical protein
MRIAKILIPILLILVVSLFFLKDCGSSEIPNNSKYIDSLKSEIQTLEVQKAFLLVKSKKSDSVRVETIIKYRYLKGRVDAIPCDSLLPQIIIACDSIIVKDSLHIANLNNVIKNDSTIIFLQNQLITSDSITKLRLNERIVSLEKKVKRRGNVIKVLTATNLTSLILILAK